MSDIPCSRRAFLKGVGLGAAAAVLPRTIQAGPGERRPDIVLVIADDWGWGHASILGDPAVRTPNFDRVVREGALFRRAYCAAPTCTASRAALLTGQMFYRLEESACLHGPLRNTFAVYPDLLEAAGYAVGRSGKGWGPGDFTAGGRTRNPAGPDSGSLAEFLAVTPGNRPICFWHGSHRPHRPYTRSGIEAGIDPAKIVVPPFLPDRPETRGDLADYYRCVEEYDREVGGVIEALERAGRLENTLLVVTSDNGMPFPRAKANLYDAGTRMPMAIRWPGRVRPGRAIDDFISLCDLAPTFLEAAGVPPPAAMTARSLVTVLEAAGSGRIDPARDRVVVGRERHAASMYPCRALRTENFLYIRNYRPDASPRCCDGGPTLQWILEHPDEPEGKRCGDLLAAPRPAEELYDLRKDPGEFVNVAADPAYADAKGRMARDLAEYLARTADPRETGRGAQFDDYPIFGRAGKAGA